MLLFNVLLCVFFFFLLFCDTCVLKYLINIHFIWQELSVLIVVDHSSKSLLFLIACSWKGKKLEVSIKMDCEY